MIFALAAAFAALPTEDEVFLAVLARIDADGDGALTAAEYAVVDASPSTFAELDTDRDGHIRPGELRDWVLLTQPRPMDRPPQTAGVLANAGRAPTPAVGFASTAPAAAVVTPPAASPWPRRVVALGTMTALAAAALAWILRPARSGRRRRR